MTLHFPSGFGGSSYPIVFSMALFMLHSGPPGAMHNCVREFEHIVLKHPTYLFLLVICHHTLSYTNTHVWPGRKPHNVIFIPMELLVTELKDRFTIPTNEFYNLLASGAYPSGIELAVLTRHLVLAYDNCRELLESVGAQYILSADVNDFYTRAGIYHLCNLNKPLVQLMDTYTKEYAAALGGGCCLQMEWAEDYIVSMEHACAKIFAGCEGLVRRQFTKQFIFNCERAGIIIERTLMGRYLLDQIVGGFAIHVFECATGKALYSVYVQHLNGAWRTNRGIEVLEDVGVTGNTPRPGASVGVAICIDPQVPHPQVQSPGAGPECPIDLTGDSHLDRSAMELSSAGTPTGSTVILL